MCNPIRSSIACGGCPSDECVELFTLWLCPQQALTQIVLVSGWSDNGWLSGGHAVRMALELCKSL